MQTQLKKSHRWACQGVINTFFFRRRKGRARSRSRVCKSYCQANTHADKGELQHAKGHPSFQSGLVNCKLLMYPCRTRFLASAAASSKGWHMKCSTSKVSPRYDSPHASLSYISFLPLISSGQESCQEHFYLHVPLQYENHHQFFLQLLHWCSNLELLLHCPKVLPCTGGAGGVKCRVGEHWLKCHPLHLWWSQRASV